ncbi:MULTISPECIES: pyridoxal phosphate-dependent aminotransferase [unclassified Achromobacter]|uniref:pyridoxal phosphate-dependent aminotransferase n=1 Tax=unclassified Achromobacter TaxID=2626865 RepID=UPI000B51A64A|nr:MULTISPECIES: pyridoxal phosphate-dependent aminotransferase [unclassified Achromobacter]OWT74711.1 aspartate aminotransferase [Achromobacter sp. HZ34]OWT79178.1 aspartate aminotransferase [Achromobacter sp. HZ28]
MTTIEEKFKQLGTDNAPGQEVRQQADDSAGAGAVIPGTPVDFSHGDVNESAFAPTPGSLDAFVHGFEEGGAQAYTEYRGQAAIRERVAQHLTGFTGATVSAQDQLIVTPGTQGALFLAIGATVVPGDKVAIVTPDYFANRKLVEFIGAEVVPVPMAYLASRDKAGIDLDRLEAVFKQGIKTFLFSNPNNPAGVIYSRQEIDAIASLANRHGVTVIVDQLYSRLLYPGRDYTHLRASDIDPKLVVTIMGPSKTESLSGFRLGVAFGAEHLIDRMEKLQAIVSLRAPGYCQAVLNTWFNEPEGWMADRIRKHQAIRDDLLSLLKEVQGLEVRAPEAGSYIFPRLPKLRIDLSQFVRTLRLHAGVTVTPGTEFSKDATDSIRLNFSQNHAGAVDAIKRTIQIIERNRAG